MMPKGPQGFLYDNTSYVIVSRGDKDYYVRIQHV